MLDSTQTEAPSLLDEILTGLSNTQKTLPAKLFYDAEGCRLFGEITRLPEYYVTRVELSLLHDVASILPWLPDSVLVEYGGSDETKALMLLDSIGCSAYAPIDIAGDALIEITDRLRLARPRLEVYPVTTDFLQPFELPEVLTKRSKFGFFPGSTIGNLDPTAASAFLAQARATLGAGSRFLVGVDLRKDPAILIPAYDDAQGVTAAFNRNLLSHVNCITGASFDPASFSHRAVWDDVHGRIEMHLVSKKPQTIQVAGLSVVFAEGETIHTESSYKHSTQGFVALARVSGWKAESVWTDERQMFSLHLLTATE